MRARILSERRFPAAAARAFARRLKSSRVTERPDYKSHPLWNEAISLTHAAYELADRVRPSDPITARHLRRAAVAVPAHVAGAISGDAESRREHVLTARGALAEVTRQAGRAQASGEPAAAADLVRRAGELDRAVSFELGDNPGAVS
jgi:23S rRNA-intervening sequence protein